MKHLFPIFIVLLMVSTSFVGVSNQVEELIVEINETKQDSSVEEIDWWPMFHHDLNHSGYSSSTGPETNNTVWAFTTGDIVRSSPAVSGGKEYVGPYDGKVYCFSDNGEQPPEPNPPYGPSRGVVEKEYTFCTDIPVYPEGDSYYIMWGWGDSEFSDWLGPYYSGETACASHMWSETGQFAIKVKLKDIYDSESNWSDPWTFIVVNFTELVPGIQMVFYGQIDAFIVNFGYDTAYEVNYSIDVKIKGIIFNLDKMYKNGTKDMLPSGSILIWTISKEMLIGIGWFKITITADAFNAEKVSSTLKGLILLCFVRIL